jgi:hypothetical protein
MLKTSDIAFPAVGVAEHATDRVNASADDYLQLLDRAHFVGGPDRKRQAGPIAQQMLPES